MDIIWESRVSLPTFSARIRNDWLPLMVPLLTWSPTFLVTGIGSPVIIDSSMALCPSVITPSTGILSPGLTLRMSPITISSIPTSVSSPSSTLQALFGASFKSSFMAAFVLLWARASRSCPKSTRVRITVAASKYTCTVPVSDLNCAGNTSGNAMPATLNSQAIPAPIPMRVNILRFQYLRLL